MQGPQHGSQYGLPGLTPPGFPQQAAGGPGPAIDPAAHSGASGPVHGVISGAVGTSGAAGLEARGPGDSRPGSPAANPRQDVLDPSPEYIAAREAALHAIRAEKARVRASGTVPALDDNRPSHPPADSGRRALGHSYDDAIASLEGAGYDIDDDDDGLPIPLPVSGRGPGYDDLDETEVVPGRTHARIPIERSPARMIVGLLAIIVGLGLLLVWLPTKSPLTSAERTLRQQRLDEARATLTEAPKFDQRFSPSMFWKAQLAASCFVVVGFVWLISGFLFRPQAEVVCKQCVRWVIADKDGIVLKCPQSSHHAGYAYGAIALTGALILCVAAAFLTIALGSIVRV